MLRVNIPIHLIKHQAAVLIKTYLQWLNQVTSMKLLVRNLARTITEKELRALFIQYGRVQSCDLVLDKTTDKSKGFAFVEMPKAGEAKVAIKTLNNKDIAGNKIRVKKAENKPANKIEFEVKGEFDGVEQSSAPVSSDEAPKKFSWKDRKLS